MASRDRLPEAIAYAAKYENDAPTAVAVLADLLKDRDESVAKEAATALGTIAAEPDIAVPALINAAQNRRNGVRWEAVPALAKFGVEARPAIPVLIKCLDDHDVVVIYRALWALKTLRLEPEVVVPALTRKSLEKPYSGRQAAALEALATFGKAAEGAVPALLPLLQDSNPAIRQAATNALKEIAPEAEPLRGSAVYLH
jgi:HEAT repeat protein